MHTTPQAKPKIKVKIIPEVHSERAWLVVVSCLLDRVRRDAKQTEAEVK